VIPAHFARDDFVAIGMVGVLLEEGEVLIGLAILLLEKLLPLIFVPELGTPEIVVRHRKPLEHGSCRCKGFFSLDLEAQLPAGGGNIVAFFAAQGRGHARAIENGHEGVLRWLIRAAPFQAGD